MDIYFNYRFIEFVLEKKHEEIGAIQYLILMRYDAGLALTSKEIKELSRRWNAANVVWVNLNKLYSEILEVNYQKLKDNEIPFDWDIFLQEKAEE